MMPFDRLIQVMDKWTEHHPEHDVLAQIGRGPFTPSHMRWVRMLSPNEYRKAVGASAIVVAHAGMGSFFTAMEICKPIVMLPRDPTSNEVTTDHQVRTLQWLRNKPGVYVAMSDNEIAGAVDLALSKGSLGLGEFNRFASKPLLEKIRKFLVQ